LVIYSALGAFRYLESLHAAEQRVSRSLRVANEHASKVLGSAESVQDRVLDLVNGKSLAELRAKQGQLHDILLGRMKNQRQLQSIWILGPDGRPVASTVSFPAPAIDLSDRAYFRYHSSGGRGRYLAEPLVTKVGMNRILDISVRFDGPDGGFGGVVNVSLFTSYFDQFYSDLVADEPGLAVNLFRADGPIYSRWPILVDMPDRLGPTSGILRRVAAGDVAGQLRGTSSVDRQDRLLAFSKVGDYPLFIGTGMNVSSLRVQLARELGVLLALGLPPFAALFFAARVALRRTREAVDAAQRLQTETRTRRRAEEALLQSQKLEAMGRLTGGVAHDFNNALMVISNNAYLLQRNVTEAGRRQLQSIGRAVDSATKLTRQLLAFSRRQALVPELVRLQDRLPATRELLAPVLGSSVRLEIEVDPDTHPIEIDPAELELALLNLSINARDAMGSSGTFTVTARNVDTDLPARFDGGAVVVEAADNGPGIPSDLLDKVFEPFFTTKPVGHGTGLGLSQVYGFCERAGGTATIASTVGKGTTVRLLFPAAPTAAGAEEPVRPPVDRQLGRSVLVVEDNSEVAEALVPLLEALGCTTTRVDSAEAALEWLAGQPRLPDLVLSDVKMPGTMDGIALAQHLRATRPGLPVLLMTGYAGSIDAITELGFEVLPKPCSPEVLGASIARLSAPAARAAGTGRH
jgi:signal transduction histidine kinase/ActR/RegA family two-component response regulator